MRSVKKWRHYCDFCKKAMMVKPAMVKHEAGCTLNPARVCGICNLMGNAQATIQELKAALEADGREKPKKLLDVAGECPMCILAAMRQYNKGLAFDEAIWPDYDVKAAMKEFWDEHNQREAYGHG